MSREDASTENAPASGWAVMGRTEGGSVHLRALRALDEPLDLLVREAGELARLFRDRDGHELVLAVLPGAAEIEALVDRVLELDGLAPALCIATRELVEPPRAHAHVRDLVGEHEIHGALDDGIAELPRDVHELVEHVARKAFEAAVDTRHPGGGVLGARAAPQNGRLGELAHVAPEVIEQTQIDLDVARLVPHLPRHVHGELPRRVGEIEDRAAGAFHRLHLADENAVDAITHLLTRHEAGERRHALLHLQLAHLPRAHANEAVLAGVTVGGDEAIHTK